MMSPDILTSRTFRAYTQRMSPRVIALLKALGTVIVAVSLAPGAVFGQAQTDETSTWTPPRTPDGQPDLQGLWTNESITRFE